MGNVLASKQDSNVSVTDVLPLAPSSVGSSSTFSFYHEALQSRSEPRFVSGLSNAGNTCFNNALLQALAALPPVHAHLHRLEVAWSD